MIDAEFTNIIQKISTEKGIDIFLDPKNIKPLLLDYTKNEYKTETDLLIKILETDSIRLIKLTENIVVCKHDLIKLLEDKYSLSPAKCDEMLDMLFLILRGEIPGQTALAPTTSAASVSNTSKNQASHAAIPANFVLIKGGTFYWQRPYDYYNNYSSKSITINDFYIANHPVTQDEWFEIMGTTQSEQMKKQGNSGSYYSGGDSPICYVNWFEAIDYCNRLSQNEGLTPVYSGPRKNPVCDYNANGYRLPSEEEWEYVKEKYKDNRAINAGYPNAHGFYYMNIGHWYYPYANRDNPFERRSGMGFRLVRNRI